MKELPEKIYKVCLNWQNDSPFFAEFLLKTEFIKDESVGTAAVSLKDGKITIFYSENFINSLTKIEVEGLMLHEILHVLHSFDERVINRDRLIFNIAQDACINDIICKTYINNRALKIPKNGVKLKDILDMGYKGQPISEHVYEFLLSEAKKNNAKKSENSSLVFGNGKTLQTTDNHDRSQVSNLDYVEVETIKKIIKEASLKSYGKVSNNFIDFVENLIRSSKINWKTLLRKYITSSVNEQGCYIENSWTKYNRRGLPLPGSKKINKKVVIGVDTSGSITNEELSKFFSEIEKIFTDFNDILLIQWDTEIKNVTKYKKNCWRDIKIIGRGGTSPQCVYDYVKKNKINTNTVINFTDGYFDWGLNCYGLKTIWVLTEKRIKPGFGNYVYLE